MAMRVTKHHIGAEIISILTRGMYPDPKDTLREYVQNGVDADAKNIEIKIRGSSIIIVDDGHGMSEEIMKDAIRVGISDKNPNADVGFRGIGIYSAFHLCDELYIYSKAKRKKTPYLLVFDFKNMRKILKQQELDRLSQKITSEQLIDLQSILQNNITLKKQNATQFPKTGTRVEMRGLDITFFKTLAKFDEVADYLRQVVPLHFDQEKFKWAKKIETKIRNICEKHNTVFKLVNLNLQVDAKTENLYRPYTDKLFHDESSMPPVFKNIKSKDIFFGVAWGCLNKVRKKINDTNLRGFLLKKQGFALGKRRDMAKHFGKRTTYFDRYIREIIAVTPNLLPNAARTDFEVSILRTGFYEALTEVATSYNNIADEHQEFSKGDEELDKAIESIENIENTLLFSYDNSDQLIDHLVEIRNIRDSLSKRIQRKVLRPESINDAKEVVKLTKNVEKQIQSFIAKSKSKKSKTTPESKSHKRRGKSKRKRTSSTEKPPETLNEVFQSLDITLSKELTKALEIIDEKFVQASTSTKADYIATLKELKEELEDLFMEE